jgi:hypothetical protein
MQRASPFSYILAIPAQAQIEITYSSGGGPISSYFSRSEFEVARSQLWEIHCEHDRRLDTFLCIIALRSETRPTERRNEMLERNMRRSLTPKIRIQIDDSYYGGRRGRRITRIQVIEGNHVATGYVLICGDAVFEERLSHGDGHSGRGPRFINSRLNEAIFSAMRVVSSCDVSLEGVDRRTDFQLTLTGLMEAIAYANQWIHDRWPEPSRRFSR